MHVTTLGLLALIAWLITAIGGFTLLGIWLARGGPRRSGASRLPVPVIFGHFLLAAAGLVVWIVYLLLDADALAWVAFILLVPVALLGFTMFLRWLPTRQAAASTGEAVPAERHFPLPIVLGHGLIAVVTVVLVLLTALGLGGS
jgi:manganese efflux pump family protein